MKRTVTKESKVDALTVRLWSARYKDTDGVKMSSENLLSQNLKSGYQKGIAYSRLIIASCCFLRSENEDALRFLSEAMVWFSSNINEFGYSWALILKASLHESIGDYDKALGVCLEAYKQTLVLDDRTAVAEACSQLGLIYSRLSDFDKALEYYTTGLKIREEINDENAIASSLNRIGMIMRLKKRYDESIDYYNRSMLIRQKNNQLTSIPWTLLGIASTCEEMGREEEALEYYTKGMTGGDKRCSMQCFIGAGRIFSRRKDYREAELNLYKSLSIADELNATSLKAEVFSALANHYENTRSFEKALEFHKLFQQTREIIKSEEVHKRLRNIEIYNAVEKSEKEREIFQLKNVQLKEAYAIVEEKNRYITSSINYASRIQLAMLPEREQIRTMVNGYFILYLPMEIISGDFYWFSNSNGYLTVAAGDCTGHGVPGALMSMLGISFLEEIVNRRRISNSAIILDELNKEVRRALRQKGVRDEARDGMNISLCVIDIPGKKLMFSGAYHNLYIISNEKLIELQADRMPVGISDFNENRFSSTVYEMKTGDKIYMFSDGYADQSGGPRKKRYGLNNLKELITQTSNLPFSGQQQRILSEFNEWKELNSQSDDILILGFGV